MTNCSNWFTWFEWRVGKSGIVFSWILNNKKILFGVPRPNVSKSYTGRLVQAEPKNLVETQTKPKNNRKLS